MAEDWPDQLKRWRQEGTLGRLFDLADLAVAKDYHSGDPVPDGIRTVRVPRSSGEPSDAVVFGLGHAGRSCTVKFADEHGAKTVSTVDLLDLNPWREGTVEFTPS